MILENTGHPFSVLEREDAGNCRTGSAYDGCSRGNVFGTYLHGLFDSGEMTEKLAQWLCSRKGIQAGPVSVLSRKEYKEQQYDLLADEVRRALDMDAVYRILEGA